MLLKQIQNREGTPQYRAHLVDAIAKAGKAGVTSTKALLNITLVDAEVSGVATVDRIGGSCGPRGTNCCSVTYTLPWTYTVGQSSHDFVAYAIEAGVLGEGGTRWTVTKAGSGAYISTSDCVPHWQ
jgi:hypothetical protein